MPIKFLRLATGEDIIAEVDEPDCYPIVMKSPLKVLYITEGGKLQVSLMQWVFYRITEDQKFQVEKQQIIVMSDPSDSMIEYYESSVKHFAKLQKEHKAMIEFDRAREDAMKSAMGRVEDGEDEAETAMDLLRQILDGTSSNNTNKKLH